MANVGHYSGPAGTVGQPMVQSVQVWVAYVNARGGLNGHPVKLLVYDDGADSARSTSLMKQAVEKEGAVAFLQNFNPITGGATADYLAAKRVPSIGVNGADRWAYENPMFFPQGSTSYALSDTFAAGFISQAKHAGKMKVGTLVCVETEQCPDGERAFNEQKDKLGFEYVYRGRGSIAQPDFTAECLAARNAGANALFLILDQNSVQRVGTACARQGYRPLYGTVGQVVVDALKKDANLDGIVGISPSFPHVQVGTPATDEFHAAMAAYGRNVLQGASATLSWTAGKVLEKAAKNLPEPPTSNAILAGLWSIKNDTLGGLTYPLTFVENKPPPVVRCWFTLAVKDKAWISPDGAKMNCL